jgi:hypothetical protein
VLEGNGQVGFRVGAYDHSAPLVIDPVLVYSTYLGSSTLQPGTAIAVDSAGDGYITGVVGGVPFVSELNASGTALIYTTYLGGSGGGGVAIAVDSSGDAYVIGGPGTNFPTTPGAFETSGGGAFVTKLNATGSALIYSTFLNGAETTAIVVDAAGNAYVTGYAGYTLPTTPNAFEPVMPWLGAGTFVTKLNASGSALVYSTFLDVSYSVFIDSGYGIAVDSAGNAYVAGETSGGVPTTPGAYQPIDIYPGIANGVAFVTKLNATGSALIYSTLLGGSTGTSGGLASAIAVDAAGSAYVTGVAGSQNFPVTSGAFQTTPGAGFVTKLNASGSDLVYSSYLPSEPVAIALDVSGDAYVTGGTGSSFPLMNALQGYGGNGDAFVSELNAGGSALLFSTYLGGSGVDGASGIALDSAGNIYVLGGTNSTNFSTTPGAYQTTYSGIYNRQDAFIAKISLAPSLSSSFAAAGYPLPTTAGVAHTFTVTALNADGTVNAGYTGTVHFTSTDPQAVLPADYTFIAADLGVHTFTVTLKTAGSQTITVADTVTYGVTGGESGIVIQPAAAVKIVLSAPASVTHGVAFSVTLTVYDAYGNVATGYTGTVHFSSSDSTATLPKNYTFTAADGGVHTFVNAALFPKKGKKTITVTDIVNGALTATDSISVS